MEKRKNAPAYQVNFWAVKNIQKEKSGIDKIRDVIPAKAKISGLFLNLSSKKISTIKKIIS